MNRTLVKMSFSILAEFKMPQKFWVEALSTAVHLRNCCPTRAVKGQTLYKAFTGKKPKVGHLKVFGRAAYRYIPKEERTLQLIAPPLISIHEIFQTLQTCVSVCKSRHTLSCRRSSTTQRFCIEFTTDITVNDF